MCVLFHGMAVHQQSPPEKSRRFRGSYDNGIGIGAQHGRAPDSAVPSSAGQAPQPQIEGESTQDYFAVYRGDIEKTLDAPPAWRYSASDALQSPSVPAS